MLVLGFAVFVYHLSVDVAKKTQAIGAADFDEEAYLVPISELRRQNETK